MKTLLDYQCEIREEVRSLIIELTGSGRISVFGLAGAMSVDPHSLRKWRDGLEDIDIRHYRMLCELCKGARRAV